MSPELLSLRVEDDSEVAFLRRVSTLKLVVRNKSGRVLRRICLAPPPLYREREEVKGRYNGLQLLWGGGYDKGALVTLPGDRIEVQPGEEGVVYFLLYPELSSPRVVNVPLDVFIEGRLVKRFTVRVRVLGRGLMSYVYRSRYAPRLRKELLNTVKKAVEEYGVPEVESKVWALGTPRPRVEVLLEGKRVVLVTGDVGSGFMHIGKIHVLTDLYIARALDPEKRERCYWVVRTWFFWLNKSVFDEAPDAERVEVWVNPDTEMVDWLVTDAHWKEVVYRGPVECAWVRIEGGEHRSFVSKLVGLLKSYHPPRVRNMRLYAVSPDSRDPRSAAIAISPG